MSDAPPSSERPKGRKMRALGWVILVLALLPLGGVLVHAVVPPPATLLMAQRMAQGEGLAYRWRPIDKISPNLVYAVIAAEDARFCEHSGFDFKAIEQAMRNNKRRPGKVRGGSTISQQTAKNVFLWPGRGWVRKGLEAGYTVLIEAVWSKRRIMEVYLNVAEWGPGVYGAEAAARRWYGKSADSLSTREAARLAAILPSPRKWKAAGPGPYVRKRGGRVSAAAGAVRNQGLAACVLKPVEKRG